MSLVRVIKGSKANQSIGDGEAGGANLTKLNVGEDYRANADAVLSYLLKGADAATAGELGLRLYGEAGPIIGKRAGFSQNIGPTARRRWWDDRN